MENMIEIILFCVHGSLSVATLFALHGYTHLFVWMYRDYFNRESLYALIIPSFALISSALVATVIGLSSKSVGCTIAAAVQILMGLISIFCGWIFSVKKYRAEGYYPDYTAFFVVSGYSVFAAVLNACLLLLL